MQTHRRQTPVASRPFFRRPHQTGEEIIGPGIDEIGSKHISKVTTQLPDHRLMVSEEICEHRLAGDTARVLQAGLFEKFCERACRIPAERTRTFRHIVDNRVEFVTGPRRTYGGR